jgi:hypothetical protein
MRLACIACSASIFALGCNHLITVDVNCEKVCLTSPGPTIPGFTGGQLAGWDGAISDLGLGYIDAGLGGYPGVGVGLSAAEAGIPSIPADWVVEMPFSEILKQLPNAAAGLSADVQLSAVTLNSTTELSFIQAVDIFIGHGTTGVAGESTFNSGALDAGNSTSLSCTTVGSSLRVAYFRSSEPGSNKASLDMTIINPDLNLFDCMKDTPVTFDVKMTPQPGTYPAADTPLSLATCIGARTSTGYP